MTDCKPRMVSHCDTVLMSEDTPPIECPTWTVCLPFGASLVSKGGCVNYIPGTNIPADGVYSKITIANGCIIDAELADIPIYTSPPCAPIPSPCDGGDGTMPDPSPTSGNLFQYDASGRPLVKLSVQPGNGITVTGDGTAANPLVITNTQQAAQAIQIQAASSAIQVTGSGTAADPFKIAHATNLGGVQGSYSFDTYGHLTAYNPPTTSLFVTGVVEGDGISVASNPSSGVVTVSLAPPVTVITETFRFGSYDVEFFRNRLIGVASRFTCPAGDYQLGDYILSIDAYGAVEDVVYSPPPTTAVHWSKQFTDSGNLERIMSFTTARASSFRVTYHGTLPAGTAVYVDSQPVGNLLTSAARIDALPVAVYGAGAHTIQIQTTTDTGFTSPGIIDVGLTDIA